LFITWHLKHFLDYKILLLHVLVTACINRTPSIVGSSSICALVGGPLEFIVQISRSSMNLEACIDLLIIIRVINICNCIVVHDVAAIMGYFNACIVMDRIGMQDEVHTALFQTAISLNFHVSLNTVFSVIRVSTMLNYLPMAGLLFNL